MHFPLTPRQPPIYLKKNFTRKADFSSRKHQQVHTHAHAIALYSITQLSIANIIDGIVFLVKNVSSCEQISIFQTEKNKCENS